MFVTSTNKTLTTSSPSIVLPNYSAITPLYFGNKHYELTDWLGNVRVVINDRKTPVNTGSVSISYKPQVVSVSDYYSFGSQISERSYDPVKPLYRFGFNTQEKIFELNKDHYTAKFWEYDARLGRRWNVDPEPTYGWSNYSVLFDNPIKNVDILGNKPLDDYKVDKQGNIKLIKKTNDQKDRLFATNEKGEILENKYIEVDKGILNKKISGKASGKIPYDAYKVRGDDQAKNMFEFLAQNTEVEWSLTQLGKSGSSGLNYLTTSHKKDEEYGSGDMFMNQFIYKYTIRAHIHNHPSNTAMPSGLGKKKTGDVDFARWVVSHIKYQPVFKIYIPRDNKYIEYDQNSKKEDFNKSK